MIKEKNTLLMALAFVAAFVFTACSEDDEPKALATPTLNNATAITATGFTVTWTAVSGADKYLLDVSLEADFDPLVTGFNKKEVTGTTQAVAGLDDATKYYFRVYAKDGSRVSAASTTKDATTLVAP